MRPLFTSILFALASAALSACAGFQPLHATAPAKALFAGVDIDMREGKDEGDRTAGYIIRQSLRDRIGDSAAPEYTLTVDPTETRIGLGLTDQDFATRFDLLVQAQWTLTRIEDGEVLGSGLTDSKTTFSADQDPFRLQTVTDQALERAARDVADQLLLDMSLELSGRDAS